MGNKKTKVKSTAQGVKSTQWLDAALSDIPDNMRDDFLKEYGDKSLEIAAAKLKDALADCGDSFEENIMAILKTFHELFCRNK